MIHKIIEWDKRRKFGHRFSDFVLLYCVYSILLYCVYFIVNITVFYITGKLNILVMILSTIIFELLINSLVLANCTVADFTSCSIGIYGEMLTRAETLLISNSKQYNDMCNYYETKISELESELNGMKGEIENDRQ